MAPCMCVVRKVTKRQGNVRMHPSDASRDTFQVPVRRATLQRPRHAPTAHPSSILHMYVTQVERKPAAIPVDTLARYLDLNLAVHVLPKGHSKTRRLTRPHSSAHNDSNYNQKSMAYLKEQRSRRRVSVQQQQPQPLGGHRRSPPPAPAAPASKPLDCGGEFPITSVSRLVSRRRKRRRRRPLALFRVCGAPGGAPAAAI